MFEGAAVELVQSPEDASELTLNMGPQHPSTHGVFRLILQLDGETVVGVRPVMGYLHRSTEKLGEARTYVQAVTLTDRMDYIAPMSNNLAYALAVEKLAGLEVPERAQYIRVIVTELNRIASHQIAVGTFGADVGTWFTPLIYTFREREEILDLFMMCAGVRMNPSYIRFGGVVRDVPPDFVERARRFLDKMPRKIDEYESLLTNNEIRGRMPKVLRPPKGDAYARIEAPKGELGFYIVSDGSTQPYRFKVRAPSFINLTVLGQLTIGHKVADAVVILGSFDIVMGEVDR